MQLELKVSSKFLFKDEDSGVHGVSVCSMLWNCLTGMICYLNPVHISEKEEENAMLRLYFRDQTLGHVLLNLYKIWVRLCLR